MESVPFEVQVPSLKSGEISMGTSIMAIEYDGGVVIGADSRTTMGAFVSNRVTNKLTQVTDHVFCLRSGSAADTQYLSDVASHQLRLLRMQLGEEPLVAQSARVLQSMCYEYRDQLLAGLIIAGWDKQLGGQVYCVPLGGMIERQAIALGGSGSTYVWGFVDATFQEKMTKQQALDYVTKTLTLALTRDGSSGGCVRLAAIDKDGVEKYLVLGDRLPRFYLG